MSQPTVHFVSHSFPALRSDPTHSAFVARHLVGVCQTAVLREPTRSSGHEFVQRCVLLTFSCCHQPQSMFLTSRQSQSMFLTSCQPQSMFVTSCQPQSMFLTSRQSQSMFLTSCQPQSMFVTSCQPQSMFVTSCQPQSMFVTVAAGPLTQVSRAMSNASFERPPTMRRPALLKHSCISF